MPKCHDCNLDFDEILSIHVHFKRIHNYDEQSAVYKCGGPGCFKTYPQWAKYRTHLKSFHKFSNRASGNCQIPIKIEGVTVDERASNDCLNPPNENADPVFLVSRVLWKKVIPVLTILSLMRLPLLWGNFAVSPVTPENYCRTLLKKELIL